MMIAGAAGVAVMYMFRKCRRPRHSYGNIVETGQPVQLKLQQDATTIWMRVLRGLLFDIVLIKAVRQAVNPV